MSAPPLLVLALAVGSALAQPPLPPEELPAVVAMVAAVQPGETILLMDGRSAALPDDLELRGVASVEELQPGDLVEVAIDGDGTARRLVRLPRLAQRRGLLEIAAASAQVIRLWWEHDGQRFPDSVATAEATLTLGSAAAALEATAAYAPADPEAGPVTFEVVDARGTTAWQRQMAPGQVVRFRCSLGGGARVTMKCTAAAGTTPVGMACIWATPVVLLRDSGPIALGSDVSARLVAALAERSPEPRPQSVAVALPRAIGVAPDVAVDLGDDLITALGVHFSPAGKVPTSAGATLAAQAKTAAEALQAEAVLTAEVRYSPEGSVVRGRLFRVATGECVAEAEESL